LNEKNLEAMSRGREYMLARIANLPIPLRTSSPELAYMRSPFSEDWETTTERVSEFIRRFGELAPGIRPDNFYRFVVGFRFHWKWRQGKNGTVRSKRYPVSLSLERKGRKERPQIELDDASAWATNILNRRILSGDDLGPNPVLDVDFSTGRVMVKPETLLDWLVWSLMECRTRLAICQRKGCATPFFVKSHPRNRYCSPECSHQEREIKKAKWEKSNRSQRTTEQTARKVKVSQKKPTKRRKV
jgi:hypothetical protein